MKNIYCNFKRYDEKGNRLAIFAEQNPIAPGQMHITMFKCSKKDQFNRKWATEAFKNYQDNCLAFYRARDVKYILKPIEEVIQIENPTTPKKCFLDWCKSNFYYLVNDKVYLPLKKDVRDLKFGKRTEKINNTMVSLTYLCK